MEKEMNSEEILKRWKLIFETKRKREYYFSFIKRFINFLGLCVILSYAFSSQRMFKIIFLDLVKQIYPVNSFSLIKKYKKDLKLF